MAAGVTVLEMMGQNMEPSLEPIQTMRCHDALNPRDGGVAALPSIGRTAKLKTVSKRKNSDYLLEAPARQRTFSSKPQDGTTFVFTISSSSCGKHKGFDFATSPSRLFRGTKRCRVENDVDGPNTAALSRKKRRLRVHLITSRLSQPFSQPATHILNRQGKLVGDKRFLKMATTYEISRRAAHLQATSYLRFSVMNRLRRRLGIVKHQGTARGNDETSVHDDMNDTSSKAPWQSHGTTRPAAGGKHLMPSGCALDGSVPAVVAPMEQPSENNKSSAHSLAKAPACRLSKPIALPLPSSDVAAMNDRTSPRIDSTPSPEPRPTPLAWMYEDHEEDSFAFLHLDEEQSGDDDSEHVYCDFDAIFGAKTSTPSDPQSPEEHTYEEYMDELDGISWRIG